MLYFDDVSLPARLEQDVRVNLTSPLALTALLLDDLVRSGAAANVNVSSLLALTPKRSVPVYCVTKAAIRNFSQALRYQFEPDPHVRAVEVLPPLVDAGMIEGRGRPAPERHRGRKLEDRYGEHGRHRGTLYRRRRR